MIRSVPLFSLLFLLACAGDDPGDDDPVDPTDDTDEGGSEEPIVVVAQEEARLSFVVSGFDASPANLIQVIDADVGAEKSLVALDRAVSRPDGEAHVCGVRGRALTGTCEVVQLGHHNPGIPGHADVDGDGRDDIVVVSSGATDGNGFVSVLPVRSGGVGAPVRSELSLLAPGVHASGDFDGDGDVDLIVSSQDESRIAVLRGDGSGAFTEVDSIDLGEALAAEVELADVDGDGTLDLVAMVKPPDAVTELWVWSGGSLTPSAPQRESMWAPLGIGIGWVADLDGDGHPDWVGFGLAPAKVHYGDGEGFEARAYSVEGTLIMLPQVVDLDGDGNLDITGTSGSAVGFSVLYGDGRRGFPSYQEFTFEQQARRLAHVADFDGDGKLDVASTGFNLDTGATIQIAFQE